MKTLLTILFLTSSSTSFAKALASRSLASIRQTIRVEHARELMGERYKRSVVSHHEKNLDMEKNLLAVVKKRLPKMHKAKAKVIAQAIIKEATLHSLDPYFVMAVISGESSFNPEAVGPVGEIGLMQIRSTTGEWMANIIKTKWRGERSLRDPVMNIKLGTAYLAWLRGKFKGQGQLYLAAYNMGAKSVRRALGKNIWPKDYPIHVMKRYIAFYKDMETQSTTW